MLNAVALVRLSITLLAAVILMLAQYAWRRRRLVTGADVLSYSLLCCGVYCFAFAQAIAQSSLWLEQFWQHAEFIALPWLPLLWIAHARRHAGLAMPWKWFMPYAPIITMAHWTNNWHHLFYKHIDYIYRAPFWVPVVARGPFDRLYSISLFLAYAYILWHYARTYVSSPAAIRLQSLVYIGATVPPMLAYVIEITGHSPMGINLAPASMSLTCVLLYLGLFVFECFDYVPLARSKVFESMRDAVLVTDLKQRLFDFNPAACKLFPSLRTAQLGEPFHQIIPELGNFAKLSLNSPQIHRISLRRGDQLRCFELHASPLGTEKLLSGMAIIMADVTEQLMLVEELQYHAETDPLTGVANRRRFLKALEQESARVERQPEAFSVLQIDVDNFKQINDRYGHTIGDYILKQITHRIVHCLRGTDLLGRMGGDEFAALLPLADANCVCDIAERIRASVAEDLVAPTGNRISASVSVGAATYRPNEPCDWQGLLDSADQALYRAKALGRNQVICCDASSTDQSSIDSRAS